LIVFAPSGSLIEIAFFYDLTNFFGNKIACSLQLNSRAGKITPQQ
jgi:hypothetical protein